MEIKNNTAANTQQTIDDSKNHHQLVSIHMQKLDNCKCSSCLKPTILKKNIKNGESKQRKAKGKGFCMSTNNGNNNNIIIINKNKMMH